jgi:hypothetical protein
MQIIGVPSCSCPNAKAGHIKDGAVVAGLNELIPFGDWRSMLEAAEKTFPSGLSSVERKAILVDAFASNLAHFGTYAYVAETTVLRPVASHLSR